MESLREFFVSLGLEADTAEFATAMTAVEALKGAAAALVEVFHKVEETFVGAVEKAAAYGDKMVDLADSTGLSTAQLQKFEWAAAQSGIGIEEVGLLASRVSRAMYDAHKGGEEAVKTFQALGVRFNDANGKLRATDEVIFDIADKFKKMPPGAERTALAMDLVGRSGAKMIPFLIEGREGLEAFGDEAVRAGKVASDASLQAAKEFEDQMTVYRALTGSIPGLGNGLIQAILPILKQLNEWAIANRALMKERVAVFIDGVRVAAKALLEVMRALHSVMVFLQANIKLVSLLLGGALLGALVAANGGLVAMLVNWTLNSVAAIAYAAQATWAALSTAAAWAAAAAPILAIAALLTLLVLIAEDVWVAMRGGKSVLGELWKQWKEFGQAWLENSDGDGWLLTSIKAIIWLLTDQLPKAIDAVKEQWSRFGGLGDLLFGPSGPPPTVGAGLGGASASPQAAAASAGAGIGVLAPTLNAGGIVINTQPGQSPQEIANALPDAMDQWWYSKMGAALPVAR